jgi:hypothetical protein
MAKRPHDLSMEELRAAGAEAARQAALKSLNAGLPVYEWDNGSGTVVEAKLPPTTKPTVKKALKAVS